MSVSRRNFLKTAGVVATALVAPAVAQMPASLNQGESASPNSGKADYTIRIAATSVEVAPNKIISVTTYNGQFPGPLLRFKEGQKVVVDLVNETDTPEQLHWHGQLVPVDVDGSAEEVLPTSPRMERDASPSCRSLRVIGSITRTTVLEPTCRQANTAARLDTSTSNPSMSRATTTARSSLF